MMNQSKTGNSSAQSRFGILALLVAVGMTSLGGLIEPVSEAAMAWSAPTIFPSFYGA